MGRLIQAGVLALCVTGIVGCSEVRMAPRVDWRNIRTGSVIPDEGYCDQPYIVRTRDGHWLCTMTTGRGEEGQPGQHVVSAISNDRGLTWSTLTDIEPSTGPAASWAMPLVTPSGRVYVFYDYNGENVSELGGRKNIRADMLGWYVFKYSDDGGRTWSPRRYRLPIRPTEIDPRNDFKGRVQMLWGIGKPIVHKGSVYLGFSKIGKYLIDESEGWFLRSDNVLTEPDPDKVNWTMLPDGEVGLRAPAGPIAEEQNLVGLASGELYTVYRTTQGNPCHAYSEDGGHHWTAPAYATYTPGGRKIKHPRACPRLWKAGNGKYLLWFHNHGGKDYTNRNPAWVTGGVERDGKMYWSQPEILLYDPEAQTRISYPDLVEQDGRYWISETQKNIARVHAIDGSFLEALWRQGESREITSTGLVFDSQTMSTSSPAPRTATAEIVDRPGWTIELHVPAGKRSAETLLSAAIADDEWVNVVLAGAGGCRVDMRRGEATAEAESDVGVLNGDRPHHVVIACDSGPGILWMVVDGILCDGGTVRPQGWYRLPAALGAIEFAESQVQVAAGLESARIYSRALTVSQAVAHCRAADCIVEGTPAP